jgi:preprotein translocase subunit SecA
MARKNDREVKRLRPLVSKINALEQELHSVPDDVLRQKTGCLERGIIQNRR